MKITKKLILYTAAQAIFCAVAPIVFVFTQYGDTSGGLRYKLPLGIVMFVFVILVFAKNTLLKPRMQKLTAQIAQQEADLSVENDAAKIACIVTELKRKRTTETVLNALTPMLLLVALLIACRAMENAILQLSGAIGFTLAAYVIGTVFGVLAAREVHGKHGE